MQLKEYLLKNKISLREASKLTGLGFSRMHRLTIGFNPSLQEIELIKNFSNGQVLFEDWLFSEKMLNPLLLKKDINKVAETADCRKEGQEDS